MVRQGDRGNAVEVAPMAKAVEEFLGYLAERGASFNTIVAYRSDLNQLTRFSDVRRAKEAPAALDRSTLEKFVVGLKGRGYRDASIARKVAAARSFFVFLSAGTTFDANPADGLAPPRAPRMLPRPLSAEDVDRLLGQPARRSTPGAKRDRAMLELLYATGMLVSELVSLDVPDVNLDIDGPYVCCRGRRGDERIILIHDRAREAIVEYIEAERSRLLRGSDERALFLNRRGGRLTRQGLWVILKAYTKAADLSADVTPHTLRHSFAAHMLDGGMPLSNVQQILGHSALSSIRVYTPFVKNAGA